jgi:hypothetical protein
MGWLEKGSLAGDETHPRPIRERMPRSAMPDKSTIATRITE